MKSLLKIGAVMAAVLVLAGFAALEWADYNDSHSPERIEATRIAVADRVARDQIQDRVAVLATDGCDARATQFMAFNTKTPFAAARDIPEELRSDMVLCLERGIFRAYVRNDLKAAGLMRFLTKNTDTY